VLDEIDAPSDDANVTLFDLLDEVIDAPNQRGSDHHASRRDQAGRMDRFVWHCYGAETGASVSWSALI
jgi:hypothetical protein